MLRGLKKSLFPGYPSIYIRSNGNTTIRCQGPRPFGISGHARMEERNGRCGPLGITGSRLTLPISCPAQPITHRLLGRPNATAAFDNPSHPIQPPKGTFLQPGYRLLRVTTQGRSLWYVIKHLNHVASWRTTTETRVEELKGRLTEAYGGRTRRRIWSECKSQDAVRDVL